IQVTIPEIAVASTLATTLSAGQARVYKVSVAAGETLRVTLDSSVDASANELYIRYGDIPSGFAYDAAYSTPMAGDQEVYIPSTQAGDYYILVKSREGGNNVPVTLRADLLPLSISKITPDQGGVGDDAHRWVSLDIYGARFKPGALVKLSRPGVFEIEPERWQVLDATHIRAVFDLRNVPYGLYDVAVTNPDGQRVTEAYRYLVERAIEADVTIGIGGARNTEPGFNDTYSVSLQSLTNVDTPYVRFDVGTPEMGYSENLIDGLHLPYVIFGTNIGGSPQGQIVDGNGNLQNYGATPTTGTPRSDIPWASLDGVSNTNGVNLAPGYALDVAAGGFVGMTFNIQTYPGLAEWLAYDFEGLRDKLYAIRPDWKAQGILDAGVDGLDNITPGLKDKFLSQDPEVHITKLESLSLPFSFSVAGAATPLTRDEFIAEQTGYAKQLRNAILADAEAPSNLSVLAADEAQWVQGWLGALETAGLLRPVDQAPPIRLNPMVISLNATLASGILLSRGGENYTTQADILGFFSKVQTWYGDTARWAGDPLAATGEIDHYETRTLESTGESVSIPVYKAVDPQSLDRNAAQDTHFISFNVFADTAPDYAGGSGLTGATGQAEREYLRHIGLLDADFNPIGPQALNLGQYLQLAAIRQAAASQTVSMNGPQGVPDASGNVFVPADTALPYSVSFNNPSNQALGQLRIVSEIDPGLDLGSLRLGDLKLGDINIHIPANKASFQGDFDFTASKGFILRVSAGVDSASRIATWLIQAIDPDTGEAMHDATRGLLAPSSDPTQVTSPSQLRGSVSYTIRNSAQAASGTLINASASIIFADAPPVATQTVSNKLDATAPVTAIAVTALGENEQGIPSYDVRWLATDDLSGVKHVTVYVAEDGGDFRIWQRQVSADRTQALFIGEAGKTYEFLAVATDIAGNMEAALISNAVLPDDGSRQAVLETLGVTESLAQTAETPLAAADRSYAANALFEQSTQHLPGQVAPALPGDLQNVLAPFTLRGFADGFAASDADIGALAMVELGDHSILASAGTLRNEVFRFGKDGGRSTTPLFTLDAPVLDMAVDAYGQLWVMTGNELLQIDADSGAILRQISGPNNEPLTHALAIQAGTGKIYVSSGNGIEIFDPNAADPSGIWVHFSNDRVGDLAFGPDGRLWGVKWTGKDIASAAPGATTDIVSFPMSGKTKGRAELEYRLNGVIDSISFGATGTALEGLLFASSNNAQRPVTYGVTGTAPHSAAVWMVELQSKRVLQLATGGTRGESIVVTHDGRILVAETTHIDELAPIKAPNVTAISVPDGSLLPLPVNSISVKFDQTMWTGVSGATA
ncbi:MAG: pre-peptidase C-terminal domain-containing protein, partial [Gammaproteobacteria bacterium]|nr:pre-peptidase C-terminal domain-containing protein [Gammaproteobacteria bacterium]